MANIKIDKRVLNFVINKYLDNSQASFAEAARDRANEKFVRVKRETMRQFDDHDVSKDLRGGPTGPAIVLPYGNLFSFLGFDASQQPLANLRAAFANSIRLRPRPQYNPSTRIFNFRVDLPDREAIEEMTEEDNPEWGAFSSWVYAVEEGVSNLSHYLYSTSKNFKNSRSGTAIQAKNKISSAEFGGREYMTEILRFLYQQY